MAWGDDLGRLAEERGSALIGYAYLLTGDIEAARDLVQEAIVRTFARPRRGQQMEWLEAYVRRVVLNLYVDGYRRARVWRRVRPAVAAADVATAADVRVVDHVDAQRALATLPPRERACVVLRFYDDLTVAALAERLGISEGTAKRYLADGLRKLQPLLGPVDPEGHDTVAIHLEGVLR